MSALLAAADSDLHDAIVDLVFVALVAGAVWLIARLAGRPDLGATGAAVVAVVGALLVLVDHL